MTTKSAKQAARISRRHRFPITVVPNPGLDPVNPRHYKGDTVMKFIEQFSLDFLDGQVVKYISRAGNKPNVPPLDDYRKALWYLQRKIHNLEIGLIEDEDVKQTTFIRRTLALRSKPK